MLKDILFVLLSIFFISSGCNKTPEKVVSISPTNFSVVDQIKIGGAFQDAMPNQFNILNKTDYSKAYEYVNTLYQTLLLTPKVNRRNYFDWTLDIIEDEETEMAFFLPGGHFYITTGMLHFIDSESQLFAVMGHELFYSDTDAMITAMRDEFGATTLGDVLLGNSIEDFGEMTSQIPNIIIEELSVKSADQYTVELICPFQYDANSLKYLIEKATAGHPSDRPLWLFSRTCNPQERQEDITDYAADCGEEGTTNQSAYRDFKENFLP